MAIVWYITCWSGSTSHLLDGYMRATNGGRRVLVDNASDPETHLALMNSARDGVTTVLTYATNTGFSLGNNAGFAYVEQESRDPNDVVVFLNSDIVPAAGTPQKKRGLGGVDRTLAQCLEDVVTPHVPALYGANIGYQHIHGTFVPYAEGWCVAGTLSTWRSIMNDTHRPWNTLYQGPYWEDNDCSLRALTCGLFLIHVELPIVHLGSGTSGPVAHHTASYEENRARFLARVQETFPAAWTRLPTFKRYMQHRSTPSDISHHLSFLADISRGFVVELGTRGGASTAALLYGVERFGGHVVSLDIVDCSDVHRGNRHWTFLQADSRDVRGRDALRHMMRVLNYERPTLVFIDTIHTYEHVWDELMLWSTLNPEYIVVHDTESFPGVKDAIEQWQKTSGYLGWFVAPNNGIAVLKAR